MVNIKSFEVENKISLAFSWESLALIWEEGPPFQFEWMECSILHPNLILSFWLKREIKIPHNAIFNSYLSTSHIQEIIKSIIDYRHGICHKWHKWHLCKYFWARVKCSKINAKKPYLWYLPNSGSSFYKTPGVRLHLSRWLHKNWW